MVHQPAMISRIDPLRGDVDLPLEGTFYPAGFPLHLATNSPDVIEAAAESWAARSCGFHTPAVRFLIDVEPGGPPAAHPVFRKQAHLLSFVSDARNFVTADTATLTAAFHLSAPTIARRDWFRWFYLEAMAYMLLTQRHVVSLHAACVAGSDGAILLCGPSGAGKSTLAFACARAGFTYLSDDSTWVPTGAARLLAIGNPNQSRLRHDAARHFPELQSCPVIDLPNGKRSLEFDIRRLPAISTATECLISSLAFLERDASTPQLRRMDSSEVAAALLAELPSYGREVNARHERTVDLLSALPAWRLRYQTLDQAIHLLRGI